VLKFRRWFRRLVLVAALFLALGGGFVGWALLTCFAEPPVLAQTPAILELEPSERDGRRVLAGSWFEERPGRSLLYLEGGPFELGFANASLTSAFLEAQERSLFAAVREQLPSTLGFWAVALAVLVNNRNLPDYVHHEHQLEILGLASGRGVDPFPQFGSRYHRLLNYHAAHDISHWVWDQPVIGCTASALRGDYTADGQLLVGRNFDWEAGEHFDRNKVIVLYRPESGVPFLSVSWPGMAGVVTGMNAERIYCSINGAHSERIGTIGRPVSLVVREVLQRARSLDEAIAIIESAQVFVADSFLLADGETGSAVVVEKAPGRTAVRRMDGDRLLQANHFETTEFSADRGNLDYMRTGTSLDRHARLDELVERGRGTFDVTRAVDVLRDRLAVGDREVGLGNRATLKPMIATHAVVAEVTAGVLWVSRGPHQLGEFDAYTIEGFGSEARAPIAADHALSDGSYSDLSNARTLLAELPEEAPLADEDRERLDRALAANPRCPDTWERIGRDEEARGDDAAALAAYREALAGVPAFPAARTRLKNSIQRLQLRETGP